MIRKLLDREVPGASNTVGTLLLLCGVALVIGSVGGLFLKFTRPWHEGMNIALWSGVGLIFIWIIISEKRDEKKHSPLFNGAKRADISEI